jgi:dihydroorotase-like cyclic amidohydrolase
MLGADGPTQSALGSATSPRLVEAVSRLLLFRKQGKQTVYVFHLTTLESLPLLSPTPTEAANLRSIVFLVSLSNFSKEVSAIGT